jgi:hypothetical protein
MSSALPPPRNSRKNQLSGLFHGFVCLLLFLLLGIVPGSICPATIVGLMLFAFGIGRKSSAPEESDDEPTSPLPWIMLLYGMAIFLGAMLNLGALLLIGRSK